MAKILLVEDNEMNRGMLSRRLTREVERTIPKRVYDREDLAREVARLREASAARGAPPGKERLRWP